MFVKVLKQGVAGCIALILASSLHATPLPQQNSIDAGVLPREARSTLSLIKQGGPFPFPKDGAVFGNYERQLPVHKRGYYHEYTVPTPHARDRGARRIIVGGTPVYRLEFFYTSDHYASFQRIKEE